MNKIRGDSANHQLCIVPVLNSVYRFHGVHFGFLAKLFKTIEKILYFKCFTVVRRRISVH